MHGVDLVEVGPRDGLQNEQVSITTEHKLELIRRLVDAGLNRIEITACVSPRAVPQMADCEQVIAQASPMPPNGFSVLVPNSKGMETVEKADTHRRVKEIAVFTTASETFAEKNINCTIAQSLERFVDVMSSAMASSRRVRGYVSTAIACPYEGSIDAGKVESVAAQLLELGCSEISLGDTIGAGDPATVRKMVNRVRESVPIQNLAIHLHDTHGNAIANISTALDCGILVIDSSIGGLGGCPFAPGAPGNVATEKVVAYLQNENLLPDGIDTDKIIGTGRWINEVLRGN